MADPTQDELDAQFLQHYGQAPTSDGSSDNQGAADQEFLSHYGVAPGPNLASSPSPTDQPFWSFNGPGAQAHKDAWKKFKLFHPSTWGDTFSTSAGAVNPPLDTTPAIFPEAQYAGGMVETPIMEGLKKVAGVKTDSTQALENALTGHAKTGEENLADFGMKSGFKRGALGMALDAFTNPTTSAWGGALEAPPTGLTVPGALLKQTYGSVPFSEAAVDAAKGIPGAVGKTLDSFAQNAQNPIANLISNTGDKVFRNTRFVRDAEKELTTGRNSAKLAEGTAGDVLGDLNLNGSDKNISDQIFKAKQAQGSKIGAIIKKAGGDGELQTELAPNFNPNAKLKIGHELGIPDEDLEFLSDTSPHPDDVHDAIEEQRVVHSKNADEMENVASAQAETVKTLENAAKGISDPDIKKAIDAHVADAKSKADTYATAAQDARAKADAFAKLQSTDPGDWITNRLADKSPRVQQSAVQDLHDLAPRFSPLWDRVSGEIGRSNGVDQAVGTVDNLLYDLSRGPRSLTDTAQTGYDWNQVAAGSKPMRTNKFLQNSKADLKNELAMEAGGTIADAIDDHVNNAVDAAPELANYPDVKQNYHVLSRAGTRAQQTIRNAMSRPPVGKATMVAGLVAAKTGGIGALAKLAAVHGANELYQSPQFGVGVSNALKGLGKTSVLDNIARQGVINQFQPKPGNEPQLPNSPWAKIFLKGNSQ